jgi:DNA-binding NtrC family response regulator
VHCRKRVATLRRVPHKTSVLIVDDEPAVRALLTRILEEAGYEVATAASAAQAIDALAQDPPAAVLCDVHMPGGAGGLWLAEQIRTNAPNTAIVLVTGDRGIPPTESLRQGVVAYVVKPFKRDALLEVVHDAVEWTHAARAAAKKEGRRAVDDWLKENES